MTAPPSSRANIEGLSQYRDIILRTARRSPLFNVPGSKADLLLILLMADLSMMHLSISSLTSFMLGLSELTNSRIFDLSSLATNRFGKASESVGHSTSVGALGIPVVGERIVPPRGQSRKIKFSVSFLNFATRRRSWLISLPHLWQIYERSRSPYPVPPISVTLSFVSGALYTRNLDPLFRGGFLILAACCPGNI